MLPLPPALAALAAWPQFVCWFAVPKPETPGKYIKFPCDWQTGAVVDAHDPQYWTTADNAAAHAERWTRGHGHGVGFVFTDADPFFFLDIDRAWDGEKWSDWANYICGQLSGAAVELSHSGRGLHIIGRTAPLPPHRNKNIPLDLELYTTKRFVALTGTNATGDAAADVGPALHPLAAQLFEPAAVQAGGEDWTDAPVAAWSGPADDEELLRRAYAAAGRNAAAVLGGEPSFIDLFEARTEALAAKWPSTTGDAYDRSSADMALANMLAFWTGKNCARMERLMRRSALARGKWDAHKTYFTETIKQANAFVRQVYAAATVQPTTERLATVAGDGAQPEAAVSEYATPTDQLTMFAGCYYDNYTGRVFSLPKNNEFNKASFDVNYGGFQFVMDARGEKLTASAWEAFTLSRVNRPPIVDALAFRPEMAHGAIVEDGAKRYLNSYVPHQPRLTPGDPTPFLDHMARIIPNERDRLILMHYLASCAQNPGRKFQWWPVLQGAEGNGKSLVGLIMTHIMGEHYTHMVNAGALAKEGMKFNAWVHRKLLLLVEEIVLAHKRDFLEEIKTLVTAERLPIERKGVDQLTGDNRANGLMFTNHEDGVPITVDTRRYSVFLCPQQSKADIERDGMNEEYFINLIDWIKGRGAWAGYGQHYGAAVMGHYLMTYPLDPAMDPAQRSIRAPETSTMQRARAMSLGRVEQEILEAIAEQRPGFAGGWVSSTYLDALLERLRLPVSRNKRPAVMASLGYTLHPHLPWGRTTRVVQPDNKAPQLYAAQGHGNLTLTEPDQIAQAYSRAQALQTDPRGAG